MAGFKVRQFINGEWVELGELPPEAVEILLTGYGPESVDANGAVLYGRRKGRADDHR